MAKKKEKLVQKKKSMALVYTGVVIIIIAALAFYFLSAQPYKEQPPQNVSPGKLPAAGKYIKLSKPSTYQPGKVNITEFLKFDCIHCYELHKSMPQLLQKYGDSVEIKYIPIRFQGQSTKSIEAYIIAEQMGKGDDMQDALFSAKFEKGMDVMESTMALETIAASIGLGNEFNQRLENGSAEGAAFENLKLMNYYNVDGTPTIIINGNLEVEPTIANLDTVIGSLLSGQ